MTRVLISSALACALPDEGAPAEIVFLPEGRHKLTPQSHPKGIAVNVPPEKGAAIAAAFNADLAKRGNVKAWCDFEHSRKYPVSCYPTSFRYEPGQGVIASVDWSKSGRDAVEGRDARFFSPEFFIGPDGVPTGIPDRGPVGAVVSEPAFRDIPAIAAADADATDEPTMSTLIFAALAISASASTAEADAVSKIEDLKLTASKVPTLEKELKEMKDKVAAAEKEAKAAAEKRADDLVKAALEDGRIAPNDTEKADKFRTRISAGDEFAEEMLAGLPKLNEGLDRPLIQASHGDRQVKPSAEGHAFEKKARELVTAGAAPNYDAALEQVASAEPRLYGDYLKTLAPTA